jgi:DNA-binding HxlR family transcriptional regulator
MSSRDDAGGGVLRFEIARQLLGDRWSLLILRDMVLREFRSFKELLESGDRLLAAGRPVSDVTCINADFNKYRTW